MTWCCDAAQNMYNARNEVGEFLVAGSLHNDGTTQFISGYNMAHKLNYEDLLKALQLAKQHLDAAGFSNIKLQSFGCVHYCHSCGANLSEHYGPDGGILRDQAYVTQITASSN